MKRGDKANGLCQSCSTASSAPYTELLGRSVILGDTATTKHPAVGFMMAIGSFLLPCAALVLSVTLTVNCTGNFASRLLVGLCKRPSAHC